MSPNYKKVVALLCGAAFVGLLLIGYQWLQQPVAGTIREAQQEPQTTQPSSTEVENDCFTAKLSGITFLKQETTEVGCVVRAKVLKPTAQVTISYTSKPAVSLDEETGVTLRRSDTKYTAIASPSVLPLGVSQSSVFVSDEDITGFFYTTRQRNSRSIHT